ncbi:MAG TPA: bacillithiol biosynthesis BshC [Gemmatimonadaceae bacterium]|nr:bacillithiol biosynthesis BshC [Gemmatimonadaceae bacterium]
MAEPIVLTEELGGSPLSRAARAGELPQWYATLPRDHAGWSDCAAAVRDGAPADWYARLREGFSASGAAGERLARAADGRGLVVTTGQQPGLFGGPLMTFVKALSARALADTLSERLHIPVAPVFWAATDDADFAEAAVVSIAGRDGARELRLESKGPSGTPMARTPLRYEVGALAEALRDACGSAPHAEYLDAALDAYHQGATVGGAYVALLRRVLEPLEVSVLDVSHAAVSQAAAPLLGSAARAAEAIAGAVRDRTAEIVAAGFSPQVEEVPGLSLVSLNDGGVKRRLTIREAASLGALRPDQFLSSTVLLRPVLERSLLPTMAYLGGPGEVAYFAQVTAVADALGLPRPLVAARWSTTIVEPRVNRVLHDLEITLEELATPNAAEGRLARARVSPAMENALRALRGDLASHVDSLRRASHGVVPDAAVEGLERSIGHRVARFERRVVAGVKIREAELMRTVAAARGALFPFGSRQERKLSFIPFLARYGPGLIERMLAEARTHARWLVFGTPAISAPSTSTTAAI